MIQPSQEKQEKRQSVLKVGGN